MTEKKQLNKKTKKTTAKKHKTKKKKKDDDPLEEEEDHVEEDATANSVWESCNSKTCLKPIGEWWATSCRWWWCSTVVAIIFCIFTWLHYLYFYQVPRSIGFNVTNARSGITSCAFSYPNSPMKTKTIFVKHAHQKWSAMRSNNIRIAVIQ